jgi:hypothetical protein
MKKGSLSASHIERVTIIFTAWKERRTFGADNSPTQRLHEYAQVCHMGIFGRDNELRGTNLRPMSDLHRKPNA